MLYATWSLSLSLFASFGSMRKCHQKCVDLFPVTDWVQTHSQGQSFLSSSCSHCISGLQGRYCYACLGNSNNKVNASPLFDHEDVVFFICKEITDFVKGNNIIEACI